MVSEIEYEECFTCQCSKNGLLEEFYFLYFGLKIAIIGFLSQMRVGKWKNP